MALLDAIGRISSGEDLSQEEMAETTSEIMEGHSPPEQIALLLSGLRFKGETVAEIAGVAAALRRHMRTIRTSRENVLDTCGTGGSGLHLFNISTAAALVTAAAGIPVAKHGNRAVSSTSGSSDVLTALGVNVQAELDVVERCLDELGICFCFAPLAHPAMRHVAEVRKKLGVPTIFNLVGPLANPASATFQLLGTTNVERRDQLAAALERLGTARAVVVTSELGLDEVAPSGASHVRVVGESARDLTWRPADFGIDESEHEALVVTDAAASASIIEGVLDGAAGSARDVVRLNAAAALWTARFDEEPLRCAEAATDAIDSGAARRLLTRLSEMTSA